MCLVCVLGRSFGWLVGCSSVRRSVGGFVGVGHTQEREKSHKWVKEAFEVERRRRMGEQAARANNEGGDGAARPAPPALSQKIAVMQRHLDEEIRAFDEECQTAVDCQVGGWVDRRRMNRSRTG